MTERMRGVLTPSQGSEEEEIEWSLRPTRLEDFVGQPATREHLAIILEAAKGRGESPDHLLFAGSPGLGKTTLANIVASELGVGIKATSGPALVRAGDLASILTNLQEGDVFFIDEIHRLARPVEEVLYAAMEDFGLDLVVGKGPAARSIRLELPRFTLIGATTRTGLLTSPLRDRFGFLGRLDYYEPADLLLILRRSASLLGVAIAADAAVEIAGRSRGTPRIANRLLRRVRDYAQVRADGEITLGVARDALALFEIDPEGLDKVDMAILTALTQRFRGKPVGLSTLAVAVGEEPNTLEEVYEPYLLRKGFLVRTPRGRQATSPAYEHLGLLQAADRLL
ncbi:MAG TPA: Holliday junction branch migration DNA helicase RuvB [Actinomycetota bacterium]|nr:Holliday junction branch migration DNA helicase RuvB [Actinomycetota bacterium]